MLLCTAVVGAVLTALAHVTAVLAHLSRAPGGRARVFPALAQLAPLVVFFPCSLALCLASTALATRPLVTVPPGPLYTGKSLTADCRCRCWARCSWSSRCT